MGLTTYYSGFVSTHINGKANHPRTFVPRPNEKKKRYRYEVVRRSKTGKASVNGRECGGVSISDVPRRVRGVNNEAKAKRR